MREMTKLYLLDDKGEKFFGEGPYRLLLGIRRTGSLRCAAMDEGMAYTKAMKLLNRAESVLGYALTQRTTGGKSGGGMQLTPEGELLLERYETFRKRCHECCSRIYDEVFHD